MSRRELSTMESYLPLVQAMQTSNTAVRDCIIRSMKDEAFDVIKLCVREATDAGFPVELRQMLKDGLISMRGELEGILDSNVSEREKREKCQRASELIGDICAAMYPMAEQAIREERELRG